MNNRDRRVVKASKSDIRAVRRGRRRAERAEITGNRVGKSASKARRNGWWFA